MNLLYALILSSSVARAATFRGVPVACQRRLIEIPNLAEVVDWRPWRAHLRELGYAEIIVKRIMRQAGERLAGAACLDDLAVKASLEEPRAIAAVYDFFRGPAGRRLAQKDAKFLLQRAPFWLDRGDTSELARLMIGALDDKDLARAVLALEPQLGEMAREGLRAALFEHLERRSAIPTPLWSSLLLQTLSVVPWASLPPALRKSALRDWVDLEQYPAWTTTRVRPRGFGLVEAGNCKHMADGHLRLTEVIPNEMHERPQRFVRVDGRLVGVLKGEPFGEPSMIALRNVLDDRGRLVLALGGVYQLPFELVASKERSAILDVERLDVGPIDFVLNAHAWNHFTAGSFLPRFEVPNARLTTIESSSLEPSRNEIRTKAHAAMQRQVWSGLTRYLNDTEATLPLR